MATRSENTRINRKRAFSIRMIESAFISLLKEMPCSKITVTDICDRADINRSTFYSNFEDMNALVEHIQMSAVNKFNEIAKKHHEMSEFEIYRSHLQVILDMGIEDVVYNMPSFSSTYAYNKIMYDHIVVPRLGEAKDKDLLIEAFWYSRAGAQQLFASWARTGKKISVDELARRIANLNNVCIEYAMTGRDYSSEKKR